MYIVSILIYDMWKSWMFSNYKERAGPHLVPLPQLVLHLQQEVDLGARGIESRR